MKLTDIKKAFYKQKPIAELFYSGGGNKEYQCDIKVDGQEKVIDFRVPFDDGALDMEDSIPAQLLIRWCISHDEYEPKIPMP